MPAPHAAPQRVAPHRAAPHVAAPRRAAPRVAAPRRAAPRTATRPKATPHVVRQPKATPKVVAPASAGRKVAVPNAAPRRASSRHAAQEPLPHLACAGCRRAAPVAPSFAAKITRHGEADTAYVMATAVGHLSRSAPWAPSQSTQMNIIRTPTFRRLRRIAKG